MAIDTKQTVTKVVVSFYGNSQHDYGLFIELKYDVEDCLIFRY